MGIIVVIGLVLVTYSRQERLHPASAAADKTPPTLTANWSEALAFDICGTIQPSLAKSPASTTIGIKTTGDGIVHVQPLTKADTGHNATLGRFLTHYPGVVLTATSLRLPGGQLYKNGQSCAGRPGYVQVKTWASPTSARGSLVSGAPGAVRLENGQLVTVAFLPRGTSVPKPLGTVITKLFDSMNAAAQSAGTTATTAGSTATVPVTTPASTPSPSTPSPSTPSPSTPTSRTP